MYIMFRTFWKKNEPFRLINPEINDSNVSGYLNV